MSADARAVGGIFQTDAQYTLLNGGGFTTATLVAPAFNGPAYQAPTAAGAVAGGACCSATLAKIVTGILDDTATTIFTITVPNPPTGTYCSALINVSLMTILGAGGGVAVGETVTSANATIVVTRTPGVAAVIGISSLTQTASAAVASGSSSVAATLTNVAVAGANTATQTFAIQTVVDDDTNSATNDICVVTLEVLNVAANGITVA